MRDPIANAAYLKRWREAHREEITAKAKAKYAANPHAKRAQAREWSRNNRERENVRKRTRYGSREAEMQRRSMLKMRYGLTMTEFEQLVAVQNNRCAVCATEMGRRQCIDHDHTTGAVRALLCHKCNRGLGHFNDDPALLRSAIAYLEKHARPKLVG